jgi:hypothetical protein
MSKTTNQSFQCHFSYEIEIYPVETPPSQARPFHSPSTHRWAPNFSWPSDISNLRPTRVPWDSQSLTASYSNRWPNMTPTPTPTLDNSSFDPGMSWVEDDLPCSTIATLAAASSCQGGIPINTRKKLRNWAIWIGEIMIYHWILDGFSNLFKPTHDFMILYVILAQQDGPLTLVTPLQWFQPLRHSTVAEGRRFLYLGP